MELRWDDATLSLINLSPQFQERLDRSLLGYEERIRGAELTREQVLHFRALFFFRLFPSHVFSTGGCSQLGHQEKQRFSTCKLPPFRQFKIYFLKKISIFCFADFIDALAKAYECATLHLATPINIWLFILANILC